MFRRTVVAGHDHRVADLDRRVHDRVGWTHILHRRIAVTLNKKNLAAELVFVKVDGFFTVTSKRNIRFYSKHFFLSPFQ